MSKQIRIPYSNTTIPPERTKADIEKMLKEHGIVDMQWTSYQGQTSLRFIWHLQVKGVEKEIMFQFVPPIIPATRRSWVQASNRYQKISVNLEATSYRLLWHYLKNKLEAVRWGLESMEKEFLSHAVVSLPDGSVTTVGENIQKVLETVKGPALEYKPNNNKVVDVEGTVADGEQEPYNEER